MWNVDRVKAATKSYFWWGAAGIALVSAAIFGFLYSQIDVGALYRWSEGLSSAWLLIVLSALPLVGFPVSILYFLVGAKLGFGFGLLLTAVSIAVNLTASHWIASRILRRPLQRLLQRSSYRLPQAPKEGHASIALLTAMLPGPYGVKNYLLALSGIPFRPYFGVCLPVYVFRASSGLLFGGLISQMSWARACLMAGYAVAIAFLCRSLLRRLRSKSGGLELGPAECASA
jgi:uncharacterized membrane protein YdjX (TVP38/TMEM64 family)